MIVIASLTLGRYRAEVKQLKMAHPEREIVKHFSYVTTRTIPITAKVGTLSVLPGCHYVLAGLKSGCGLNDTLNRI